MPGGCRVLMMPPDPTPAPGINPANPYRTLELSDNEEIACLKCPKAFNNNTHEFMEHFEDEHMYRKREQP